MAAGFTPKAAIASLTNISKNSWRTMMLRELKETLCTELLFTATNRLSSIWSSVQWITVHDITPHRPAHSNTYRQADSRLIAHVNVSHQEIKGDDRKASQRVRHGGVPLEDSQHQVVLGLQHFGHLWQWCSIGD